LLAVFAAALFLASLVPTPPNDFWWHLRIGRIIAETGQIPTTNMYGWTIPLDQPFVYGAWLGEYLLYKLYQLGGLELAIFARTLMLGVALALLGQLAKQRSGSWRLAAGALLLIFMMITDNLVVRPQIWSWVPFVVTLTVLEGYARGRLSWRMLLLCPLAMVFWVNVHGAFVLGIVLAGTYLVGEIIGRIVHLPGIGSWSRIRALGLAMLSIVLATFVNPRGLGVVSYVVNLMRDPPSQQLIVEWQPPALGEFAPTAFFVTLILLLAALWYSHQTPRPTDVLLLIGFLWLAFNGRRYIVWFAMVAVPMLVEIVPEFVKDQRLLHSPTRNYLNLIIVLVLFVPVVMVQPWWVERRWVPLPQSYWDRVLVDRDAGPLLAANTPVGAAAYLAEHPVAHIFNEMGMGSYFIWALPDQPVFIDTRVELYPFELWQEYIRISRGIRYNDLLAKHGVERIVLDVKQQRELSLSLESDPIWQLVYSDEYCEIWDRYSAEGLMPRPVKSWQRRSKAHRAHRIAIARVI
jgi:hypothetical protein